MTEVPVNPAILKWARVSMGLSIEDVAAKFKKTSQKISAWEAGKEFPTYPQLEKLADEYKRPIALFFFSEVPHEDGHKVEFRSLPDTITDNLPPQIIKLYREAKVFQYNLEELYDGKKPVQESLLDLFSSQDITNIEHKSRAIREQLKIPLNTQLIWNDCETAFKHWRTALENNGIFVFKAAFKHKEYSGFCLYHEKYPIIYINNSTPFSRQIFSLFHELAHLLVQASGIDFLEPPNLPVKYSQTEQFCNRLASETLVPRDILKKRIFSKDKANDEAVIEKLANNFSVSREVILRNLLEMNFVDRRTYENFTKKWNASFTRGQEGNGGNYYFTKKAYLGDTYIRLAYEKFYRNKIDSITLAECLNVKPKNLANFEHLVFNTK